MSRANFLRNAFSAIALTTLSATQSIAADNNNFITNDPSNIEYAAVGDTESPAKILVLLHGSGDNYKALADLAETIAQNYQDLLILVPNGPESFAEILQPAQIQMLKQQNPNLDLENMRNWSDRVDLNGTETEDQIMQLLEESQYETADALNALIQSRLDQFGLNESDVSLYGFSAGGSMAMYTGLRANDEYNEVLNHSGALYGPYENPASTPPISIIIGDRETALLQGLPVMVDALQAEGVNATSEVLENTGHEITNEMIIHFRNLIEDLVHSDPEQNPAIKHSLTPE